MDNANLINRVEKLETKFYELDKNMALLNQTLTQLNITMEKLNKTVDGIRDDSNLNLVAWFKKNFVTILFYGILVLIVLGIKP